MKKFQLISLFIILLLSFSLRAYGINWDNGFHLHPDERAIILFSQPLAFPLSFSQFFSVTSPLNPHFFAYGSFPLYLLKLLSSILSLWIPFLGTYDGMSIVGRIISTTADLGTLFIIFLLGKRIFTTFSGLLGSLFYGLSTLALQTSHFYVVDPLLTFLVTLCLYCIVLLYNEPSYKKALLVGILFGLSLATKNSAVALISSISFTLIADIWLLALRHKRKIHLHAEEVKKIIMQNVPFGIYIFLTACITFFIFEPYALIDFSTFLTQTLQQYQMTKDAFTFPYTLQYVDKIPYLYEIKNMFLWGQGPVLFLFSLSGLLMVLYSLYKKEKQTKWPEEILLILFLGTYFFVVGKFAVGFMRYMLPMYPLLALFAGIGVEKVITYLTSSHGFYWLKILLVLYIVILVGYWPLAFLHIYSLPNTRVQATNWIQTHIAPGSHIAIEHWDDSLPLLGQDVYTMITLPLYDPDTNFKWQQINQQLTTTDYIIIASNRLYVPLQKLADCNKHPFPHCYPLTANYYTQLFHGEKGFKKIAEFASYPTLPFSNQPINDQEADESFTVYDHPKVMIFQKVP